jgi:DNA-binding NarL/FixJ family response regulator
MVDASSTDSPWCFHRAKNSEFSATRRFLKTAQRDTLSKSMEQKPIKVVCVDDSADITALLSMVIDAQPDMESAATLHAADELPAEVARSQPDVVILDLTMPGRDPLEVVEELASNAPSTRIIVYSGYDDAGLTDRAIDAGAWGHVSKHHEIDMVLRAIRHVAGGKVFLGHAMQAG